MMSSYLRQYSEKRDFIRMRVEADITVKLGNPPRELTGICRDLSGTGMLIELSEPVAEGVEFFAALPSNNPNFPSLEANVRVLRCAARENGSYELGVEILRIQR